MSRSLAYLPFSIPLALPCVLALGACSDYSGELSDGNYRMDAVRSVDELKGLSCSSKNEGETVIMITSDNVSLRYQCEDGAWVGDDGGKVTTDVSSSSKGSSSSSKSKSSSSSKDSSKESSSSSESQELPHVSSSSMKISNGSESSLGSCVTVDGSTSVGKGSSIAFKFVANGDVVTDPLMVTTATYEWDYGDNPVFEASGNGRTSDKVLFNTSGTKRIHVTVTIGDTTETVACPIRVVGAPITGCECTTEKSSVDYNVNPDVVWTVSGCSTAGDVLTYTWNGTVGATDFTKTFIAAQGGYAPTLSVSNEEYFVVDVTCPAVKATDGPEYIMNGGDYLDLPAGITPVQMYAMDEGSCEFRGGAYFLCTFEYDGDVKATISIDGSEPEEVSSVYSTVLPCEKVSGGNVVTVELSRPATCSISN